MAQPEKPSRILRQEDVWHITSLWREGESCALVGIGSSGKSRLAQSFLKENVRRFAFGDDWQKYLIVYVDGNGLLEDTAWGLYEGMVDSAIHEISKLYLDKWEHPQASDVFGELKKYHHNIISGDRHLAYRWVARAVNMLFLVAKFERIVFILDDIDHLLLEDSLDPALFRHLKSLRDHHKYQLCYTVATRRTANDLAGERLREIDDFYKLIKSNTLPVGVYSWDDAELMVQGLMERNNFSMIRQAQVELIRNSGCHPGMLRAAFFALLANQDAVEIQVGAKLTSSTGDAPAWSLAQEHLFKKVVDNVLQTDPIMLEECYIIWDGLSERERVALKCIVDGEPVAGYSDAVGQLGVKKLLTLTDDNTYAVFSPIFEALVPQLSTGAF